MVALDIAYKKIEQTTHRSMRGLFYWEGEPMLLYLLFVGIGTQTS